MSPDAAGLRGRREWMLAGGWALLILVATSLPLPAGGVLDRPPHLFGVLAADKVGHATMYAVLGWLTVGALSTERASVLTRLLAALAAAAAFAALDEWHQAWIPSRTAEIMDWVADASGVAVGAAARAVRERTGSGRGRDSAEDRGDRARDHRHEEKGGRDGD